MQQGLRASVHRREVSQESLPPLPVGNMGLVALGDLRAIQIGCFKLDLPVADLRMPFTCQIFMAEIKRP